MAPRFIHVGTGGFGRHWCLDVLSRLVQLSKAEPAAAVDINPENLANAQKGYGLPPERCYTDAQKAFDENDADFAIIVVPPNHHESVVDLALAHDLDILSEKPIADTMEGCCRIYRKVKAAGKRMAVTMSHRFGADTQTLARLIHSGRYGALSYVIGRNTWAYRKFGAWGKAFRHQMADPLLIEGTVHHFDTMRSLTGGNAKTVYALGWNPPWGEYGGDSTALITVDMDNGTRVFYEGAKANATTLNGWTRDYWRAECDQATLELDSGELRTLSDLDGQRHEEQVPLDERPAWKNPWLAELFADWLAGGPAPANTLDDNIHCAALLFAAIESAHTGRVVHVPEFLEQHLDRVGL